MIIKTDILYKSKQLFMGCAVFKGTALVWIFIFLLVITQNAYAQRTHVKGRVVDIQTGERLIGAALVSKNGELLTVTNENGEFIVFYSNKYLDVKVQHVSYSTLDTIINTLSSTNIVLQLSPRNYELQDVTIEAIRRMEPKSSPVVSQRLDSRQLNSIPGLLGEKDIVKGLMLLPGVSMGSETSSAFYVRGGNPDQNLILIDGVPVYNISHLFGIYSVFIPEAIQEVELIKGGFPARYGGRLSSVCDVRMREGDRYEHKYDLSVGSVSSKFVTEGPIVKDRSSFIVAARRTYLDLITLPFQALAQNDENYQQMMGGYFYDVVVKTNHRINSRNSLFLSFYSGSDVVKGSIKESYPSETSVSKSMHGLNWGNTTWIARLYSSFSSSTHSNLSVSQSNYKYGINSEFEVKRSTESITSGVNTYTSGIVDWAIRWDVKHQVNNHLGFSVGLHSILHRFTPGEVTQKYQEDSISIKGNEGSFFFAPDASIYSELHYGNDGFNFNAGLRASAYFPNDASYYFLEPRLSLSYEVNHNIRLRSGFTVMNQNILMLSSNGIGLPVDLWVPATRKVQPQRGVQYDLGITLSHPQIQHLNFSLAGYYKHMKNVVEIAGGMSLMHTANQWEQSVTQGEGESYGMELLIEKPLGRLTGWLSYTISWNNRLFSDLNQGKPFPFKYDNRHVANISANYRISSKIELAFAWTLQSGNALTLPVGMYEGSPEFLPYNLYDLLLMKDIPHPEFIEHYPYRNNARMPAYHRLDFGANFSKKKRKGVRVWEVGVYNAYSQKNPYYLYWDVKDDKKVLRQFTLLPILPSITYRFKF